MRCFRSISKDELAKLMLGIPITGKWNKGHHSECGYSGYWGSVVCAFTDEIRWTDETIHSLWSWKFQTTESLKGLLLFG